MAARWPSNATSTRGIVSAVTDYGALTLRDWLSYYLACWRGRKVRRRG